MPQPLCASLRAKIQEQTERALHLLAKIPSEELDWAPPIPGAWTTRELAGHLFDCMAGFCAVLQAAEPDRLAHFALLRTLPGNQGIRDRLHLYQAHIDQGLALLEDSDLSRTIPTVFVPAGETLLTLLLGNLEHLINHKHQLFIHLKLMGADVGTSDLYRLRG